MFAVLLPILKSKLAVLGAVIIICLLIALGGPRVIGQQYALYCWLLAGLILVGYLIYLGISKWKAKKNARMLEGFLNQQADDQMVAQPDVQDELEAIKKKLNSAIRTLKSSRIAKGRRGAEALYVLPWYMIIGPSASGKSTAIRNSGLHFPPVDPDSEDPGKIKGLGGTRNCDWWFSNEGIILDTAGRYTLSQNVQEDREEWLSFLDMLRKARPRAPINGLILAISMDELLQKDADQLDAHARALRARVDELIMRLQIMFPIYVVFTKCDLVSGFVESFSDLSKVDREQVWGFTRRSEAVGPDFGAEFAREFDLLQRVLEQRRITNLEKQTQPARKRGVYMFPVELGAAREHLTRFIETLFRPNPYQQNPIVRGVYFTSGTQEGTPIAQVIGSMSREFGLPGDQFRQGDAVQETKAYFIRDLFQEIILGDETMVAPTTQAYRRRRLLRGLAMVGQVVVTGLLILLLVLSYGNNRQRNKRLADETIEVINSTRAAASMGFQWELLDSLDRLRTILEEREKHTPLMAQWGLHSGGVVESAARQAFFERFHDLLVLPTKSRLETQLSTTFDCDNDSIFKSQYAAFTAYQMLTLPFDSVPPATGTLKDQILKIWVTDSIPEDYRIDVRHNIQNQVDYYWAHRADTTLPPMQIEPNLRVVANAREEIGGCWTPNKLFITIIEDVNAVVGEFRYTDATRSSRVNGGSVGGAFTKKGWEDHVRPQIQNMPQRIAAEPQLRDAFAGYSPQRIQEVLSDLYANTFVSEWRGFLSSGDINTYYDMADAFEALVELGQDPSPMIDVLKKVYENSRIQNLDGDPFPRIEDEFYHLGVFLGQEGSEGGDNARYMKYLEVLNSMSADVQDIEAKLAGEARCANNLRQFKQRVTRSESSVKQLIPGSGISSIAVSFLTQPLAQGWTTALQGACACLERQWKTQVYDEFEQFLSTKYPFNPSSDADVSITELQTFFTSKFRSFVRNEMEGTEDLFIPVSDEFNRAMNAAQRIIQVLSGGAEKLRFTLTATAVNMRDIRYIDFQYGSAPPWRYVMGPPVSRDFRWPPVGTDRVEMRVDPREGGYYQPLVKTGDWCIFRLLDAARNEGGGTFAWDFESSSGNAPTLTARLTLSGGDQAFILDGHFTMFKCPESVCRR